MSLFKERICRFFLVCILFVATAGHAGTVADIDRFTKPPSYLDVQISPDGKKLGVIVMEEGRRVLALMTLEPLAFTYVVRFAGLEEVGEFYWANNDRVLLGLYSKIGLFDSPLNSGRMYAVDYNGRKGGDVFGHQSPGGQYAHAEVISLLPDDRKHVLISTYPWSNVAGRYEFRGDRVGEVLKLNIYSGRTSPVVKHPAQGGRAYVDPAGKVRFAMTVDEQYIPRLYRLEDNKWSLLKTANDRLSVPVGYSDDLKSAYLLTYGDHDTLGLERFDFATGTQEAIFRHDYVDLAWPDHFPGSEEPMGVELEDGLPSYHFFDDTRPWARFFRSVLKAFEGKRVNLESVTPDGRSAIFRVSADRLPGEFYYADVASKKIGYLFSSRDWLDADSLARTEVIELTARDDTRLQGYLTFPSGARENLPMVVIPHGGPMARNYWIFDEEVQLLAASGYLVLQVNFRGSSGYGAAFEQAAYRHWGTSVQDDITDAVLWAVNQGFADRDRVAIFGASFGGYSAMMSAIREPGLYRCAAGYAGVYDLSLLYEEGDIRLTAAGRAYLDSALSEDRAQLESQSPVAQASRLTVPVFIAHGGQDRRAPIEHAESLIAAALANKLDYVAHINDTGGHGFYTMDAKRALYTDLLAFLDRHMKPR